MANQPRPRKTAAPRRGKTKSHNCLLHESVTEDLPHTYRLGSVEVTIYETEYDDEQNRFTVLDADAKFAGEEIQLDLPFHYINASTDGNPLGNLQEMIADTVRYHVSRAHGRLGA